MKIANNNHPAEKALQLKALQLIEDILIENNMTIRWEYGLVIEHEGREYKVKNVAGMSGNDSLPRFSDEDKLVIEE